MFQTHLTLLTDVHVCNEEIWGIPTQKGSQMGSFLSVLITLLHLILKSGLGHVTLLGVQVTSCTYTRHLSFTHTITQSSGDI